MRRKRKPHAELLRPPSGRRSGTASSGGTAAHGADNPALQAIWHVVCAIPRGQVTTYGAVARAAGFPGRARQSGYALKVAPADMHVPWHRVVGAGGRIVFPRASRAYREQARRLRAEGVPIADGRVSAAAMTDLEGS